MSKKSNPLKALNNILAYAKPFFAKFCPVIGSLYLEFMLQKLFQFKEY